MKQPFWSMWYRYPPMWLSHTLCYICNVYLHPLYSPLSKRISDRDYPVPR